MSITHCPYCGSTNVRLSSYGHDLGKVAGTVLGGLYGTPGVSSLLGKAGKKIDKHIVRKYRCKSCDKSIWD